ncbi:MAG: BMP family ABC transporter substrate-binding protein [Chloroflexota bacterium]
MSIRKLGWILALLMLVGLLFTACGAETEEVEEPAPAEVEEEPAVEEPVEEPAVEEPASGFEIPAVKEGMTNVAMVLIGPHDDGGWSQAHYEGLVYVADNNPDVHIAYIENVPEGAESEQVFRSLSRKGFDLIFGTSFGYMDSMEILADEFPNIIYIHISGYKSNMDNFGNLFGAMENMKYLAGMLAGSRAKMDGNPKLGYMATFPIPEEIRLGNAIALGMKQTCPECTLDVRWINTWHDPVIEKEAAASLFDAGAQVVFTGADTPAVADVAQEKGKWGVTYDWYGSCKIDACLTAPYWIWGPVYQEITDGVIDGTYEVGWHYYDADTGGLGLFGFMEGEELPPGVAELPEADIQLVRDTLAQMLAGEFTRFDVFAGPIEDNQGNTIVPAGEKMQQADLDQFPPGAEGLECDYCMYFWADGITAELPEL